MPKIDDNTVLVKHIFRFLVDICAALRSTLQAMSCRQLLSSIVSIFGNFHRFLVCARARACARALLLFAGVDR